MSRASKKQLPLREWPGDDQQHWKTIFEPADLFDEAGRGAHLALSTREALRASYAQYLRFVSDHHHELLDRPAEARINRQLIAEYEYRDGLLIALLALFILRRRTVTAIRIGRQLVRSGELWALAIPPEDTKNDQALDFSISVEMSRQIDVYLEDFRVCLPDADSHNGLWASNKRGPMSESAIYDAVRRRTRKAFGVGVNLHRFRHAAASFWSIQDPVNVRGVKDLAGHASYDQTTNRYYVKGQSRLAGRALAKAIDAIEQTSLRSP